MLQKLLTLFKGTNLNPVDPSVFGDSLAGRTSWKPLVHGGNQFRNKKLVQVSSGRYEYQPVQVSLYIVGFVVLVVVLPVIASLFPLFEQSDFALSNFEYNRSDVYPFAGIGLLIVALIAYLIIKGGRCLILDKTYGSYWYGKASKPNEPTHSMPPAQARKLGEVRALQILGEHVRRDKANFESFEINLVKSDGSRVNLADFGPVNKVRDDAQKLAQFLNVPIWDVTDETLGGKGSKDGLPMMN